MSNTKQRHGLLDIYRFILGFWVMFHHNFFFVELRHDIFSTAQLSVDFFFVISGYFLLRSMQKKRDEKLHIGMKDILWSRLKPLLFSICFITSFNVICIALFIRENFFSKVFDIFRYWWYVLYLLIAAAVFYLLFKLIKNKWVFIAALIIIAGGMAVLDYLIETRGILVYELTFWTRAFGCIATGMLISYIPKWNYKKINFSIPIVIILIPTIFYLAYGEKDFFTCILMIVLFTALVYFSTNIPLGGKVTDIMGKLSTRMYLYMSFVTTLYFLGLTHHRILFVIDVALAVMDLLLAGYKEKYERLKKNSEMTKENNETSAVTK